VQDWVRSGFVCGSAADVAAEIRAIGDRVPVDPVLTRAHWPGMTSEQAVANIDSLGRELVPALRDYAPVPDLPEDARP
jgi:hypothetical protein